MVFLLTSKVRLHWGFIVRQLRSGAAQLSYVLPPPPTVVGAFMNPLARMGGLSDGDKAKINSNVLNRIMECAISATLSASVGVEGEVGVVSYEDVSRLSAAPYKKGTRDYEQKVGSGNILDAVGVVFPVQAIGASSGPFATLHLAWLMDLDKLNTCLKTKFTETDLKAATLMIHRIGSKEGIASVIEGNVYSDLEKLSAGDRFETIFYQNSHCVDIVYGNLAPVLLPGLDYNENLYYVPVSSFGSSSVVVPPEPAIFQLKENCSGMKVKNIVLTW
ncbi:MAG: CRISPR-associated protein Cas5 [Sulfolobus sp.]|nr:CRISPR-associated protein Cas5 [Sulfolobus sp.]